MRALDKISPNYTLLFDEYIYQIIPVLLKAEKSIIIVGVSFFKQLLL